MPKNIHQENPCNLVDKDQLLKLKMKAMRAGVWFRALRIIDRVLVDLTLKVVDVVRSPSLAKSILSVTEKLEGFLESRFSRIIREIGFSIACKLSLFAQKWGNHTARLWVNDLGFARYLAVMHLNGHQC